MAELDAETNQVQDSVFIVSEFSDGNTESDPSQSVQSVSEPIDSFKIASSHQPIFNPNPVQPNDIVESWPDSENETKKENNNEVTPIPNHVIASVKCNGNVCYYLNEDGQRVYTDTQSDLPPLNDMNFPCQKSCFNSFVGPKNGLWMRTHLILADPRWSTYGLMLGMTVGFVVGRLARR